MKEKIEQTMEEMERNVEGGEKNYEIACKARDEITELKGEFEYMKTRFSP